jgi:hypothetical protein
MEVGLDVTERMQTALDEYRAECDSIGNFFAERILPADGKKLQTSALYAAYTAQSKLSGNRPMSVQAFVGEVMPCRCLVFRNPQCYTVFARAKSRTHAKQYSMAHFKKKPRKGE